MTEKDIPSQTTDNDQSSEKNTLKPVSKIGSWILALALTLLFALWMLSGQVNKEPEQLTEKQRVEQAGALPEVQVRRFALQSYSPTISLTGETVASRSVTLKAEASGTVRSIHFSKGDSVEKNQLLLTLDPGTSAARIRQAKVLIEREQLYADSIAKLVDKGLGSQLEQVDARNRLESAKVQLSTARNDYSKSRISAPYAGILVRQHVELGDFVAPGTPLFDLVDVSPMLIRVHITEKELAMIQNQSPVANVTLSTGERFKASMRYLSPVSEDASKTFIMDFDLNAQGTAIQIGLSANVTMELTPVEAVAISPALLFLDNDGNPGLKYVNQDSLVDYAPVTIVQVNSDATWVIGNGLDQLDQKDFIVTGQGFVYAGDKVVAYSDVTDSSGGRE